MRKKRYVSAFLDNFRFSRSNFGRRLFDACAALLGATMFFLDRMNELQPTNANRLDALAILIEVALLAR